jgi:hypothetical protein
MSKACWPTETIGLPAQVREREREREREAERTMTQERGRIPNEPFSLMTHDQGLFVLHLHVY